MTRIRCLSQRPSRRREPGRPETRTVSIRLEPQPPPGIPGLGIQRQLAYGDAEESAFNETSALIRRTPMAGNILQEPRHRACHPGLGSYKLGGCGEAWLKVPGYCELNSVLQKPNCL